jgi:radical SAM protein with 4Fe4S-binding SPASM domain
MQHECTLNESTVLVFPKTVDFVLCRDVILAVSAETANWLVLKSDFQKNILTKLVNGETIGSVLSCNPSPEHNQEIESLLAQIMARNFASTDIPPVITFPNFVESMYVYLTNACNLRCSHCYMYSGKADKQELSVRQWKQVLAEFRNLGGLNVTFTGGELLLKNGWLDIIKESHELGLKSTILTNGTLWSKEDIESAAPFIDEVQISIDGPDESSNAIVRGKGGFALALETAKNFSCYDVITSVAATPTLETLGIFDNNFADFALSLYEQSGGRIIFRIGNKLLDGRDTQALSNEMRKHYFEITRKIEKQIYPSNEFKDFALTHEPNTGIKNCGFGGLSISSDGKVFPCNRIYELKKIVDVNSAALTSIFDDAKRIFELTSVDNTEPCNQCNIRYICGGGCRIDEYSFQGQWESIEPGQLLSRPNCDQEFKESLYNKMIGATDYLYDFDS